jgi:hypothetical protein
VTPKWHHATPPDGASCSAHRSCARARVVGQGPASTPDLREVCADDQASSQQRASPCAT